jgi:hypothetical protein
MEREDHGRVLKQQAAARTPGHNLILAGGCFSWPPSSSYTCGYCRRGFRSAQALGGHTNVHRRDRARLRQCCHNHLIAAHHHRRPPGAPPLPSLNFLPPHCAGGVVATTTAEPVVYSFFSTTSTSPAAAAMKAAVVGVNLDLGIAGGGVSSRGGIIEGGLDLELRLGCSWE